MEKVSTFIKRNYKLNYGIAILLEIISAFIIAFGVKIFISPNGFLSTGFTGIGLIIGRLYDRLAKTQLEAEITSVVYMLLNIPVLILAWKKLSKRFTILSLVNVVVCSVAMAFIPSSWVESFHLSVRAGDIGFLDAALFVGAINGSANALAFIVGGSTGGTDVISSYFSIKKQTSIGKINMLLNGLILLLGYFVTDSDQKLALSLYTMVYIVINNVVIDLFYVRNRRTVLFIATTKGQEIANLINKKFIRGVTEFDAKGAYTGQHKDFLYCACSSFEVMDMINQIKALDEHAFITVIEASKIHGNFLNKDVRS